MGGVRRMKKAISKRLCLAVLLAFGAAEGASAVNWFDRGHGRAPEPNRIHVCHGYTCRVITPVVLTPEDIAAIAGGLSGGTADPAAERAAISHAVQVFERIVGARIGTGNDLPGMQFGRASPDQMDCIDEATNTTSLLVVLDAHGYLKHHRVAEPASRGFFLDGRYPHATAVLAVNGSREKWAVDSWPNANGEPPVVQPLPVWRRDRGGAGS